MLGLKPGASASAIKAAWRRLAREHHPDVSAGDPVAERIKTRRMAEINAAYEVLRDAPLGGSNGSDDPGSPASIRPAATATDPAGHRPARHDRHAPTEERHHVATRTAGGRIPPASRRFARGPPTLVRAAPRTRTGRSMRSRVRRFRPPTPPTLVVARATEMPFGKFHGHTLGEIAAFEPSYIDWMATTITREPDLLAAARVLRDDLDARGVVRRLRPMRTPPGPPTD